MDDELSGRALWIAVTCYRNVDEIKNPHFQRVTEIQQLGVPLNGSDVDVVADLVGPLGAKRS